MQLPKQRHKDAKGNKHRKNKNKNARQQRNQNRSQQSDERECVSDDVYMWSKGGQQEEEEALSYPIGGERRRGRWRGCGRRRVMERRVM